MTCSLTLAGPPCEDTSPKPHHHKKVHKIKDLPLTWISSKNQSNISWNKNQILYTLYQKAPQRTIGAFKWQLNKDLETSMREKRKKSLKKQSEQNCRNSGKSCTKTSSLHLFNFCLSLAGHYMVIDARRATSCICKLKTPSLPEKTTNVEGSSEN